MKFSKIGPEDASKVHVKVGFLIRYLKRLIDGGITFWLLEKLQNSTAHFDKIPI